MVLSPALPGWGDPSSSAGDTGDEGAVIAGLPRRAANTQLGSLSLPPAGHRQARCLVAPLPQKQDWGPSEAWGDLSGIGVPRSTVAVHGAMGGSWSSPAGPGGMRDVGTGCRQQPCGELHKLPIWQPSPAGEGRPGPAPAAIPSSLCRLGLLPQPSFLGKGVDGDSKWGNDMAPPSPALLGAGGGDTAKLEWGVHVAGSVLGAGR